MKALMGFDEINRMPDKSDASSGTGDISGGSVDFGELAELSDSLFDKFLVLFQEFIKSAY